jgi:hypothetical protein
MQAHLFEVDWLIFVVSLINIEEDEDRDQFGKEHYNLEEALFDGLDHIDVDNGTGKRHHKSHHSINLHIPLHTLFDILIHKDSS